MASRHRRRRGTSPAAPRSPLEDEDLLMEILLRLPREPSSLPRASAVRKQWGRLATDPKFVARFRAHHGKPPLLGVFELGHEIRFRSVLDPPDRIPPERLSLGRYSNPRHTKVLGCRHGRVLVKDWVRDEVVVCDPITGKQHRVSIPPKFNERYPCLNGAVLCAAGGQGHVHGGCHSCPFKVVLVSELDHRPIACV
uniref:F-box domain-containing protein n=2 Tax=Triticum urartu TaxID=4572 RepID=A0A8R7TQ64_TRIUA